MEVSINWADKMTIQTFAHLATMTTLFAFNGQYLVRVEILEEERTSESHERKLRMTHYHPEKEVEKKINCFICEQKQNACFLLLVAM